MLHRTLSHRVLPEGGHTVLEYYFLEDRVRFEGMPVENYGIEIIARNQTTGQTEAGRLRGLGSHAGPVVRLLIELADRHVTPQELNNGGENLPEITRKV